MLLWVVRQRFRSPLRVLAAALCLLFVAAPSLPTLHHLLVAHVVCPEHGELLHVSELSGERSEKLSGVHVQSSKQLSLVAAPAPGHDACGVPAWGASEGFSAAALAASVFSCLSFGSAGSAPDQRPHAAIALLSYAPKLAPPCQLA
jgi:hypothetical protein